MMQRLLVVMALALVLALVGCSVSNTSDRQNSTEINLSTCPQAQTVGNGSCGATIVTVK